MGVAIVWEAGGVGSATASVTAKARATAAMKPKFDGNDEQCRDGFIVLKVLVIASHTARDGISRR